MRTICSNIWNMDPLPNMKKVYSMILRNIARSRDEREEAVEFSGRSNRVKGVEAKDK